MPLVSADAVPMARGRPTGGTARASNCQMVCLSKERGSSPDEENAVSAFSSSGPPTATFSAGPTNGRRGQSRPPADAWSGRRSILLTIQAAEPDTPPCTVSITNPAPCSLS